MKTLLLLRHAKSGLKDADIPDYDRPLNKRGERDLPVMAEAIEERGLIPHLILYSTALRTALTAEYMLQYFDIKHTLGVTELYAANQDIYENHIADIHDIIDVAMIIGHNPTIENLYVKYTGQSIEKFPTCACAALRFDVDTWKDVPTGKCELVYYISPNIVQHDKK